MLIRWTGLGFLAFLITCGAVPAAYYVTQATYRLTGSHNVQLAELAVAVLMLPIAALMWGVGRWLNSEDEERHTVMDQPMEYVAGLFLFLAWLLPCVALGQVTSTWLGWVAFFGVLPAVAIGYFLLQLVKAWPAARAEALAKRAGSDTPPAPPA
ncbi:hypothetical protein Acy02nite_10360 [Actinoplanes cyaneus]|uniref:Uncharacterized protein n=1 Tax=Actinoplanes cyaneus TaxID=52696 RepID=A0A919LYM0_9ACTN|nr:hypothetical protein [Actinoplanes cyaneus]MCW2137105.1 hypothetical protein [Actinoplanes cyaneus]GID63155.1 hypothetical protein Acy02nite_10360 [Actinoplanes cyaneus]